MAFGTSEWIKLVFPTSTEKLDDPEALRFLQDQLEELAYAFERTDPQGRLTSSEFAGYLCATFDNNIIFVPWSLVRSCPSDHYLEEFVRLASSHCLCEEGATCLSGSSAGAGSAIEIGDVDFCQYTELLPPDIYGRIEGCLQDVAGATKPIVVRYGATDRAQAPRFEQLPQIKAHMTNHGTLDSADRCLLEYLADDTLWDCVPVSNVILPCDFANRGRGAASRSFVFQETVLHNGNRPNEPAWSLVSAREMSAYLNFLIDQINYYKSDKPLKALKRALALAYTIQLFSFVDDITDLLLSDDAKVYIREIRVIDSETLRAMRDELEPPPANVPILHAQFRARCEALADQLLQNIQELRQ